MQKTETWYKAEGDCLHILLAQRKIEDAEVFFHAFGVRGFGNHDDSALD